MHENIIRIYWYEPLSLEDAIASELAKEQGLYYITRIFGSKETSLYIGKASHNNTIQNRLKSHRGHWLPEYRGKINVRIGHVIYPRKMDIETEAHIIDHAESAILYDKSHQNLFPENVDKRHSYSYTEEYCVENIGNRYQLTSVISMNKH